jgi:hypothetical protein
VARDGGGPRRLGRGGFQPAKQSLEGLLRLFEDDDVLDFSEMEEPGDAEWGTNGSRPVSSPSAEWNVGVLRSMIGSDLALPARLCRCG